MAAPRSLKVNTLHRHVTVCRANVIEKAGLKKLMAKVIDQMMVCEEGPHRGQFIACHKTDQGQWNNFLTYLRTGEMMENVRGDMLKTRL